MTALPHDLQTLVERYAAGPTPAGREAAVLAGLPLVRSLLGKLSVPDHPLASYDDLESAGLVGLIEALDAYDPARGVRFMTFAYLRVRGALVDYLRSLDVLSLDKRKRLAEAGAAAEALRQETGAEPPDRAVADRMGLSLADYDALLVEAQARFALSLDGPAHADDDSLTLVESVPDHAGMDGFRDVEREPHGRPRPPRHRGAAVAPARHARPVLRRGPHAARDRRGLPHLRGARVADPRQDAARPPRPPRA